MAIWKESRPRIGKMGDRVNVCRVKINLAVGENGKKAANRIVSRKDALFFGLKSIKQIDE
jgi:hypothetical protein